MWADAHVMAAHAAEYRWRPLLKMTRSESSVIPFPVGGFHAAKFGLRPFLECHAVTLPIQENARAERKLNFGRIPLGDNSPKNVVCSVSAQEMTKHRAKFG